MTSTIRVKQFCRSYGQYWSPYLEETISAVNAFPASPGRQQLQLTFDGCVSADNLEAELEAGHIDSWWSSRALTMIIGTIL